MSVLAIVPARSGSKRLPGKNLRKFCGKPLMQWTIEQALRIKEINQLVVTSDYGWCDWMKGAYVLTRPEHLCQAETPMAQVICDVLANEGVPWPDLVCLLQPTSPTRTDETVRKCIQNAKRHGSAMTLIDPGMDALIKGTWGGPKPNGACYVFPPHRLPPLPNDPLKDILTDDVDVDTLKDFERAEAVMRERMK